MSRTNRSILTDSNHREARKGRSNRRAAWDSQPFYGTGRGGNMIMSGIPYRWWDERLPSGRNKRSGTHRDAERRQTKRAERQNWKKEVEA